MLKTLLVPVLSGCLLVIPASVAPARADGEDLAKVLAGIAALYVVGRVIEERRGAPFDLSLPGLGASGQAAPVDARRVPAACHVSINGNGLGQGAYDRQCVERSVAQPGRLPQECRAIARTERGRREIYDDRCLAQAGWQLASR